MHLHGELKKVRSTIDHNLVYDLDHWELKSGDKCENGSQLRPHIVWFGEAVPNIILAEENIRKADVLIIVGTSLNVYPAAGLVDLIKEGAKVYLVDPANVTVNGVENITVIKAGAVEGLAELVNELSSSEQY